MAFSPDSISQKIVLASASPVRAELLRNAGVEVDVVPVKVDEATIKMAMLAEGASARDIADHLAEMKARRAAGNHPGRLVIGCDQVLVQEGKLYDKPTDLDDARAQLKSLRGRTHELLSAVAIFENSRPVWRHIAQAQLSMRAISDDFLEAYLAGCSASVLSSVGCYHLEGPGAQLFTQIRGDYFCVLGLPLLEVLGFLRTRGICQE